jgi:2-polyprenyl-6-methoxyphenol hydroxylase-like FAD-dependent oxidoreductase
VHTQVIIIGAGPTGLMAACQMARFNIDFIIIDTKPAPTHESRAMLVTARSMEIYQQMGIVDTVLQQGKVISKFSIYMNGREKAALETTQAGDGLTDFPNLQAFEQFKNEELLYEQLKTTGNDVLWRTSLVSFEQNEDFVLADLYDKSDPFRKIAVKASYLLACDGASSLVRQQLGMNFAGGTYQNKFFVADVQLNWQQPQNKLIASLSRINFCAFFPMYGNNNYRILGTLPESFACTDDVSFDDLKDVITANVKLPLDIENLNWFSVYKLHHRCIDQFRISRCFLLGDAAHIHSPAGGQGMNTGLQDAHNLAWKMAMVLQGVAGERLIDTYHTERYPFAQWLMKFTDNIFAFMTGRNRFIYLLRTYLLPYILRLVLSAKWITRRIFRVLSQVGYSYKKSPLSLQFIKQKLQFSAGDRCPYVMTAVDGKLQSVYHLLTEAKFHLLCIGGSLDSDYLPDHLKAYIKIVNLPLNESWQKLGVKTDLYLLIRPDNYIGLLTDEISPALITGYFDKFKATDLKAELKN